MCGRHKLFHSLYLALELAISNFPSVSVSKRVLVWHFCYGNCSLILIWMKTGFERETEGSSEMASFLICKAGQERVNVQACQWVPDTRDNLWSIHSVAEIYLCRLIKQPSQSTLVFPSLKSREGWGIWKSNSNFILCPVFLCIFGIFVWIKGTIIARTVHEKLWIFQSRTGKMFISKQCCGLKEKCIPMNTSQYVNNRIRWEKAKNNSKRVRQRRDLKAYNITWPKSSLVFLCLWDGYLMRLISHLMRLKINTVKTLFLGIF